MYFQDCGDKGGQCDLPSPLVTPVIPGGGLSLCPPRRPLRSDGSSIWLLQNTKLIPWSLTNPAFPGLLDHISLSVSTAQLPTPWISQHGVCVLTPKTLLGSPQAPSGYNSVTCLPEGSV